ncbi:hypothetical protein IM660_03375 [Ruania alkalisoli]|uniref:Uncharacterized protein n=1 Tax=Ruania alkalisoli TaxID=2779775 RepID=A0A7M1SWM9_9MICO|nr:hypothetical protein [Ruania alkalisoli]QOR71354.1 hypothetical protein IM660_03375 [Ruania alkalisoli]
MNLDDELRRDAERSRRMDGPNPLTGRVEEIASHVRRRRRGRTAAGATVALAAVIGGVWGVTQTGLLDWQAPPPASPSPTVEPTGDAGDWCGMTLREVTDRIEHAVDAEVDVTTSGGTHAIDVTLRSEEDVHLTDRIDVIVAAPGTDQILAYSVGPDQGAVTVPAGGEVSLGRSLDAMTVCVDDLTGAAPVSVGALTADDGAWWATSAEELTFVSGRLEAPAEETEEPSPDPETDEPSAPSETEEARTEEPAALLPPPEFLPECGDTWIPPTTSTGLRIEAEWGDAPLVPAAIDGRFPNAEVTIENVSSETLGFRMYLWTILVQDGIVVSPQVLGTDAILRVDLAPGEVDTQTAGHGLADRCNNPANGYGNPIPAGSYTIYTMLMDYEAYQEHRTRNPLAISEGAHIEVTGG